MPPRLRIWGMVLGAGVAVVLRIVFTLIVSTLMVLPYLKLVGGLALLYIAIRLLVPNGHDDEEQIHSTQHLWRAVRTVAIADIIMSLDNVIAVAEHHPRADARVAEARGKRAVAIQVFEIAACLAAEEARLVVA